MTLYVHYNANTFNFVGFYDSEMNSKIPEPVKEITAEQHKEFYRLISEGQSFEIGGIVVNPFKPVSIEYNWDEIRNKRDGLLRACDWSQLVDIPAPVSERYKEYRQALRDVTKTFRSPNDVVWPSEPV